MRVSDGKESLFIGAAATLAWVVARVAPTNWEPALFFGIWIALIGVLKVVRRQVTYWRAPSWFELASTGVVTIIAAALLFNPTILGGWTLIVVFGLYFAYGILRLVIILRRGDGGSF